MFFRQLGDIGAESIARSAAVGSGGRFNRLPKFAEYPRKVGGRVMSIEARRIRQNKDQRWSNRIGLLPEDSTRLIERQPISADAKDCQHSWLIVLDPVTQLLSTTREFIGGQFGRCYGRTFYQIGDSIPVA